MSQCSFTSPQQVSEPIKREALYKTFIYSLGTLTLPHFQCRRVYNKKV